MIRLILICCLAFFFNDRLLDVLLQKRCFTTTLTIADGYFIELSVGASDIFIIVSLVAHFEIGL